jgi:hypothetical protein
MCCFLRFTRCGGGLDFFGIVWRNVIGPCGAWVCGFWFVFFFNLILVGFMFSILSVFILIWY